MRLRIVLTLVAMALPGGCGNQRTGPIDVSMVVTPSTGERAQVPSRAMLPVTDVGLVRLDREGQVIPAAALRWAILGDGLDYIFRIDDAAGVTAPLVARRLRAALRRERRSAMASLLAPIDSIAAVTATVVEIRVSAPQPDFLLLLARPEFVVGAVGPMRALRRPGGEALLLPRATEDHAGTRVVLRQEPVGRAVARFAAGHSAIVLGGGFTDLAVARAARPRRGELRFDPASGLFGFAVRDPTGPAGDAALRKALALALDRDRIVALLGAPGQAKATTLAGSTIEAAPLDRRAAARMLLARHGAPLGPLRVAMPGGPGARLLFMLIAQDWRRIGVGAIMVPADAPADLALVDMVAPPGALAPLACAVSAGCDPRDRLALIDPPFIALATPVRWSLVTRGMDGFVENALAAHPLDQLRTGG